MPETDEPSNINRERKRLTGVTARKGHAGVAGGTVAMVASLFFVGMGVFITLIGLGVVHVKPSSIHAPMWVISLVGLIFFMAGAGVFTGGLKALRTAGKLKQRAALHPNEPWMADHLWDPEGTTSNAGREVFSALLVTLFIAVFLTPFNYIFVLGDAPFFAKAIIGFFDLFLVGMVGMTVYRFMRWQKYGQTRLVFTGFPFFLGQTLDVNFISPRGIGSYTKLKFELRCIEVEKQVSGSGKNRSTSYIPYRIYQDLYEIDQPGELGPTANPVAPASDVTQGVPITFLLPSDGRATNLSVDEPTYWELLIHADTPGVDFEATYLLPVYKPV
ncbi:MAG: hypothetical protein GC164_07650 [Phycisphaera sp.]|nr:hypothetical protein [Phycisphaera sp.]